MNFSRARVRLTPQGEAMLAASRATSPGWTLRPFDTGRDADRARFVIFSGVEAVALLTAERENAVLMANARALLDALKEAASALDQCLNGQAFPDAEALDSALTSAQAAINSAHAP